MLQKMLKESGMTTQANSEHPYLKEKQSKLMAKQSQRDGFDV